MADNLTNFNNIAKEGLNCLTNTSEKLHYTAKILRNIKDDYESKIINDITSCVSYLNNFGTDLLNNSTTIGKTFSSTSTCLKNAAKSVKDFIIEHPDIAVSCTLLVVENAPAIASTITTIASVGAAVVSLAGSSIPLSTAIGLTIGFGVYKTFFREKGATDSEDVQESAFNSYLNSVWNFASNAYNKASSWISGTPEEQTEQISTTMPTEDNNETSTTLAQIDNSEETVNADDTELYGVTISGAESIYTVCMD